MTSRKDYVAIAAILKNELAAYTPERDPYAEIAAEVAVAAVAERIATYFASANPAFDRGRFLRACGIREPLRLS